MKYPKDKPHEFNTSPYGGCYTCGAEENARIHQPWWWRILNGKKRRGVN